MVEICNRRVFIVREGQYKYQITKQKLLEYIAQLPEKEPLPNRNVLARQCGVARVTLERAISELIGEGALVSIDGRGTYPAAAVQGGAPRAEAAPGKLWAFLTYSVTRGMTPQILRGVEDFADSHDVSLIVCNTDNDPQKEARYLHRLLRQNVSGIVLIPCIHSIPDPAALNAIRERGIPLVACSRQVPGCDFPGAFQNFFHAGFMATQHLLDQGCRRIAYFATRDYYSVEDRLQGYLAALEQHNSRCPGDPARGEPGLRGEGAATEGMIERFLDEHPETDGVYLFNDRLAAPLYAVMRRRGLRPGRDVRVISSEDSGFCQSLWVPLSALDFPSYRMGAISAEQLYRLQNGVPDGELKREVLSGELIVRESSAGE